MGYRGQWERPGIGRTVDPGNRGFPVLCLTTGGYSRRYICLDVPWLKRKRSLRAPPGKNEAHSYPNSFHTTCASDEVKTETTSDSYPFVRPTNKSVKDLDHSGYEKRLGPCGFVMYPFQSVCHTATSQTSQTSINHALSQQGSSH